MATSQTFVKPQAWSGYVNALKDGEVAEGKIVTLVAKKFTTYTGLERNDQKQVAWDRLSYADLGEASLLGKAAANAIKAKNAEAFASMVKLHGELSRIVDQCRALLTETGYTIPFVASVDIIPTKTGGGKDRQYIWTDGEKFVSSDGQCRGWSVSLSGRVTSSGVEKPISVNLYSPAGAMKGSYSNLAQAGRACYEQVGRNMKEGSGSVNGGDLFSIPYVK